MDLTFDPEADSLKEWETLLERFSQCEGVGEVISQTDWDPTFQTRRSAIVSGGVNIRILQWFNHHDDGWFIKYEIEVSGTDFHLKSAVMEVPLQIIRDRWEEKPTKVDARSLGSMLGKMGCQLSVAAS